MNNRERYTVGVLLFPFVMWFSSSLALIIELLVTGFDIQNALPKIFMMFVVCFLITLVFVCIQDENE